MKIQLLVLVLVDVLLVPIKILQILFLITSKPKTYGLKILILVTKCMYQVYPLVCRFLVQKEHVKSVLPWMLPNRHVFNFVQWMTTTEKCMTLLLVKMVIRNLELHVAIPMVTVPIASFILNHLKMVHLLLISVLLKCMKPIHPIVIQLVPMIRVVLGVRIYLHHLFFPSVTLVHWMPLAIKIVMSKLQMLHVKLLPGLDHVKMLI